MAATRLNRIMLAEVAYNSWVRRERSVFLCRSEAFADRIAFRFRKVLHEENYSEKWFDDPRALQWVENPLTGGLCKPAGSNPSFVQLHNGAWVFFQDINDLEADEDIGPVQFVYWPTLGGNYEKVTYDFWRSGRSSGNIHRPLLTVESKPKGKANKERNAWDIIMEDDDDA
jgi:hypothetical protein